MQSCVIFCFHLKVRNLWKLNFIQNVIFILLPQECPDCKTAIPVANRLELKIFRDHVNNCGLNVGIGYGLSISANSIHQSLNNPELLQDKKQAISIKDEVEDVKPINDSRDFLQILNSDDNLTEPSSESSETSTDIIKKEVIEVKYEPLMD